MTPLFISHPTQPYTASLTLTNSTVSGNSAVVDGGGIYAEGGEVGLFNATIAENLVDKAFTDNGGTAGACMR